MNRVLLVLGLCAVATPLFAQDQQLVNRGKQEEQRSCVQCHSLRLVDSQRLTQAGWEKEITKMIGWGAVVQDRQVLLDYLSQQYGVNTPLAGQVFTANGVTGSRQSR